MPFYSWRDVVRDLEPNPSLPAGMSRQSIVGERAMLCMHEAFPRLKCQPHQHEAEQFSLVIQGRMRFTIGSEERVLGPGEVAYIPSQVSHSIESLEEYVQVLDVFAPLRPDILARLQAMERQ
ncbi:MAG TPA: cupin domain-containing protein [Candidatus Methylomirabilis sp.]|nr:cupin domain-containing protein [Candidatus Methylomirabilis sp.]HSB78597.1 cupin domain-containing protein [Candidatus Methylomirabilis sp.]